VTLGKVKLDGTVVGEVELDVTVVGKVELDGVTDARSQNCHIKDEVSVGAWDSFHNIVMVERFCAAPSSQAEDGNWFHPGMDYHHDSGLAEGLGGEDCWVWLQVP